MKKFVSRMLPLLAWAATTLVVVAQEDTSVWSDATGPFASVDTVTFEHLGDQAVNAHVMLVDSTGIVYAGDTGVPTCVAWLDPEVGTWNFIDTHTMCPERMIALHPDTLIAARSLFRSLDSGQTWTDIGPGLDGLYQAPFDSPYQGMLLSGTGIGDSSIWRSMDRGETWDVATGPDVWYSADDFVVTPPSHPFAGRVIAVGVNGILYSEDLGLTWQLSHLWEDFRYLGWSLAITASGRILAIISDTQTSGWDLYGSWDGVEWEHQGSFIDDQLSGVTHLVGNGYSYSLPDGSLYVMTGRGRLWRMVDEDGYAWELVGQIPEMESGDKVPLKGAHIAPDGTLYVAVSRNGPEKAWAWQSTGPVVIAGEEAPEQPATIALTAHPNPSSGVVEVGLELAAPVEARVAVFDLRGREIALLHDGPLPAGAHAFTWENAGAAAGVYVVKAEAGEEVVSRRVTIAR